MISESKPGVAQISRLSPLRLPPHQPLHKPGELTLQIFVWGFFNNFSGDDFNLSCQAFYLF